MKITIIVPIYKVEKYLKLCVDSIINQTFRELEIILIDDGSPDNCGSICDNYAESDCRIKVIHKANGGLVSAWKTGVEAANGDFIAFIDSDDYVSNDYLAKMASDVSHNHTSFCAMSCTRFHSDIDHNKWVINTLPSGVYHTEDYLDRIICDNGSYKKLVANSRWAKLIRADIVRQAMQSCGDDISYGEDLQLILGVLMLSNTFSILDEYDYYYRYNPTSIVNTYREDSWNKIKRLFDIIKNIPNICMIPRYEEQINSLIILYADDIVKHELAHKNGDYQAKIRAIFEDDILLKAYLNYSRSNMGRFDKLMSKAVKSRSLLRTRMTKNIYDLYCKMKG